MTYDPKFSLEERLELERLTERMERHEQAREIRVEARRDLATEIRTAQKKIVEAEEDARRCLPTPLTEEAGKVIDGHPAVFGRRHELKRLIEEFGPLTIEQAEAVARAIEEDEEAETTPSSSKPSRKSKGTSSSNGAG